MLCFKPDGPKNKILISNFGLKERLLFATLKAKLMEPVYVP